MGSRCSPSSHTPHHPLTASAGPHDVHAPPAGPGGSLYPPIQPAHAGTNRRQQPPPPQQQLGYQPPAVYPQPYPHTQPANAYPSAPQHQPHLNNPSPASQPPRQHQTQQQQRPNGGGQGSGSGGSSSSGRGGGGGPDWLSKPLKLFGAAAQKVDSAVQSLASELGSSSCAGCGRAVGGFGPTLRALGKEWHPGCFR